jgi:N-glycosidase YbiA
MNKEQVNDYYNVDNCYKVDDKSVSGFFEAHRWLSHFHPCSVFYEGDMYPSAENAFQAAKALWCDRPKFVNLTPSEAKAEGAKVCIDVDRWNQRKKNVMRKILWDKFNRNQDLKELLLATGLKYLEEANWWGDVYWGTCGGAGENNLGKLLMEIRGSLRGVT